VYPVTPVEPTSAILPQFTSKDGLEPILLFVNEIYVPES